MAIGTLFSCESLSKFCPYRTLETPALADSPYSYDVFISYSTQDKAWVRGELLHTLENAGLTVCIDFRDFRPGAPIVTEIRELLKASKKTLVVLTPSYIERDWTEFETLLLQTKDPTNRDLRLIPIRKEICEIPDNMGILTYVDFAEPDDLEFAWTRLLTALGRPPQPAPAPETPTHWFLAHPYGMPPNFTGRRAELQTLGDWLSPTQHPLFVLRALGGFGKSALTWHWLTHDVDAQQWPQVVWWSFYEESANFNNFLRLTLAYLTGLDPDAMPPRQQLDTLLRYLAQRPVLLVMDGFERELRAYSGMGAAYQGDEIPPTPLGKGGREGAGALPGGGTENADSGDLTSPLFKGGFTRNLNPENLRGDPSRDCINPLAETFLRGLASLPHLRGKVLMSTRLRPRAVELHGGTLLAGCYETELTEMQPDDAVEFFRRQGIAGNRGEIEQACRNYGFHPLSLRLLAGYIAQDFEHPGDICAAASLDVTGDLVQRRNHVLERSYENLTEAGRRLLGRIACFRSPVAYGVLEAIKRGDADADDAEIPSRGHSSAMPLRPLRPLQASLRDLINRGLLQQDTRTTRAGQRVALFDLHPIVRRYAYGRMAAGDRTTAHGQLRDYFAAVPAPEKVTTLDDLTPVIELYHHMVQAGQYDEAMDLFYERINKATYYQLGGYQLQIELLRALFPQGEAQPPQLKDEGAQAWTLNALANSYSLSGQPGAAVPLFGRGAGIFEQRGDKKNLAIALGNLADDQARIGALQAAEANLRRSIVLCREIENEFWEAVGHQELGRLLAYRGAWPEAEGELTTALELFEKNNSVQSQGIIWAYRSQAALLQARSGETQAAATALAAATRALELADETASDKRYVYPVRDYVCAHWLLGAAHRISGNLTQSETHFGDALTRCRTINLVDFEADILLDLARLRADQGQPAEAQRLAQAALAITERSGYALHGADVQLFLAQQALEAGDRAAALAHAQIARQLATCDGDDHVYRVAYDEAGALLAQLSGP